MQNKDKRIHIKEKMQKQKNNLPFVVRETIEEKVYYILKQQILEKRLERDSRLVQDDLAKQLGTSRIPIRSALQRLEMKRLVRKDKRGHYFVSIISESEIAEIFNIRILIETYAAKQALPNLYENDFSELRRINLKFKQSIDLGDISQWLFLNKMFHFYIYEASGMPRLVEMIKRNPENRPTLLHAMEPDHAKSFNDHEAIIFALESKNLKDIETLFKGHLLASLSRWKKYLSEKA